MEIAKYIVAFVAIYSFGGLIADGVVPSTARQHLYNPAWPPHAKFHNGQTMLLGIVTGTIALVLLFAVRPLTLPLFLVGAAAASAYWVTMALTPFFPGTAWYDPEFEDSTPRPFGLSPQQILTYVLCGLTVVAIVLAVVSELG